MITDDDLNEFFTTWKTQLQAETSRHEAADKRNPLTTAVRMANTRTIAALDLITGWQREKAEALAAAPTMADAE